MANLTARQAEILAFIKSSIEDQGLPPTRAEIAQKLGFKSPNAAEEHVKALARKGAIEMIPGASRGIRIVEDNNPGLPIVGKVAAGSPILAQEHISDYCEIPQNFFHPNADYLLEVTGDSMKNVGIMDGDLIAVHRTETAKNGDIVVARLDEEVTVKRWKKRGNKVSLLPENNDLEPIEVNLKEVNLSIEGLYVGVIRRH